MHKKKFLIFICTSIAFIIALIFSIPFISSLKPNARAENNLTEIDFSKLDYNKLYLLDIPRGNNFGNNSFVKVAILKQEQEKTRVWELPSKQGAILMPEIHWWRPIYSCKDFGISPKEPVIACLDQNTPNNWKKHWQWDLNGKNINGMVEDLFPAKGILRTNKFLYQPVME